MNKTGGDFTGNDRFEGFIIDLLTEIKQMPDFADYDFEIKLVADNQYGGTDASGRFIGMVGDLYYGVG